MSNDTNLGKEYLLSNGDSSVFLWQSYLQQSFCHDAFPVFQDKFKNVRNLLLNEGVNLNEALIFSGIHILPFFLRLGSEIVSNCSNWKEEWLKLSTLKSKSPFLATHKEDAKQQFMQSASLAHDVSYKVRYLILELFKLAKANKLSKLDLLGSLSSSDTQFDALLQQLDSVFPIVGLTNVSHKEHRTKLIGFLKVAQDVIKTMHEKEVEELAHLAYSATRVQALMRGHLARKSTEITLRDHREFLETVKNEAELNSSRIEAEKAEEERRKLEEEKKVIDKGKARRAKLSVSIPKVTRADKSQRLGGPDTPIVDNGKGCKVTVTKALAAFTESTAAAAKAFKDFQDGKGFPKGLSFRRHSNGDGIGRFKDDSVRGSLKDRTNTDLSNERGRK